MSHASGRASRDGNDVLPGAVDGEDEMRQCRFCLSCETDEDGGLIEPCECSGSMRYVHRDCLRTWQRTVKTWSAASTCPICGAVYRDCNSVKILLLRLPLRFPVTSVVVASSGLLWMLAPRLHCHMGGGALMHITAPLPWIAHWRWNSWENQSGPLALGCRAVLSGVVCLTLPALVDHMASLCSGGALTTRLCEFVFLVDNMERTSFIFRSAWARSFGDTEQGQRATISVQRVVAEVLKWAFQNEVPIRLAVSQLRMIRTHALFDFEHASSMIRKTWRFPSNLCARCHEVNIAWPFHLGIQVDLLHAQATTSPLQRLIPVPVLWSLTDTEVFDLALSMGAFAAVGVMVSIGALSKDGFGRLKPWISEAFSPRGVLEANQIRNAIVNLFGLLCSITRGARAVRLFALRL